MIERTQKCVDEKMLYRCLTCEALMEYHLSLEQFEKGGSLYDIAVNTHKKLDPTKLYSFPSLGMASHLSEWYILTKMHSAIIQ